MATSTQPKPLSVTNLVKTSRARVIILIMLAALTALVWSVLRGGTSDAPVEARTASPQAAVAAYLLADSDLIVAPEQVIFLEEPVDRAWTEALGYVPLFVLAHKGAEGDDLEDLYYLEARLKSDGTPLSIRRLTNITSTPHARERVVANHGLTAVLSVEVFGQLQSMMLVDFGGDEREIPPFKAKLDGFRHTITNLQDTGREAGIGMRLYKIEPPATSLQAKPDGAGFEVSIKGDGTKGSEASTIATVDAATGELRGEGAARLSYQQRYYAAKQFTPWLVDTIRNLSFVGPKKIALLERFAFQWADKLKRWAFAMGLLSEDGNLMEELGEDLAVAPTIDTSGAGYDDEWPPPPVMSAVPDPKPGEGQWSETRIDWLRTLPGAPPAFMKTAVRMDPERPYQVTVLIAMDMRQLDMHMVAGTVTPESSFGTRGDGLIPREPEIIERLVAAFNGGFKTAHGAFGMAVDRKIVLPAMPFAATVTIEDDKHVKMGSWNNSMEIPPEIHSLRQNLPPLIADGKLNPTGRRRWGGTASDLDNVHTTRSGMCFRGKNTLIFVWGTGLSADSMGNAMLAAGCDYGMHLDMNPTHTGWSYYRAEMSDLDKKSKFKDFKVEKGGKTMDFREDRYIHRDVKDFFYLTLRRTLLDALPKPPEGFGLWSREHAPVGVEGFLEIAGVSTRGDDVLVALDTSQLTTRLQRGGKEPDPTASLGVAKSPIEAVKLTDPVVMLDLGLTDIERPTGFKNGRTILAPIVKGQPALVRHKDGRLEMLDAEAVAGLDPGSVADLRGGLPLLVDGAPVAPGEIVPNARHHAVGFDASKKYLYILSSKSDPRKLASALKAVGVELAMLLPSGPAATPVRFLKVEDKTLNAVDPLEGALTPIASAQTTQLYFERHPEGPRVTRLQLEPVELSAEEAKRQKRLLGEIKAMREELRSVENAKYEKWIQKIKEQRENKK